MISSFLFVSLISIFPMGGPVDALASAAQLELQLAEIQKLLSQNLDLSKQNREDLRSLVDELVSGADAALISLEKSRMAHQDLMTLSQKTLPSETDQSYDAELANKIGHANAADSESAMALQQKAMQSQKASEFGAIDAQASIQTWQALTRISIQLQELTQAIKSSRPDPRNLRLDQMSSVFGSKANSDKKGALHINAR